MNPNKEKIEELLKLAETERKKINIPPKKFKRTDDGRIILNPNKSFDKDWYENDESYSL